MHPPTNLLRLTAPGKVSYPHRAWRGVTSPAASEEEMSAKKRSEKCPQSHSASGHVHQAGKDSPPGPGFRTERARVQMRPTR